MILVGAMGLAGSGKDTLIDYLCRRCRVHKFSVGDFVRQIAEQEGIDRTRENLHSLREAIGRAGLVIENDGSLYEFYERIERSLIGPIVSVEVPCERGQSDNAVGERERYAQN
jgi:dephospho-CoA kinase